MFAKKFHNSIKYLPCVLQGEKDWQKYETARKLKVCRGLFVNLRSLLPFLSPFDRCDWRPWIGMVLIFEVTL